MYCRQCGKQLREDDRICNSCGATVNTNLQKANGLGEGLSNRLKKRYTNPASLIQYVFIIVVGIIMLCYALITYSNDTSKFFGGYTYTAPFTNHECVVIFVGILGFAFLMGGLIDMCICIYFIRTRK